MNSFWVSAHAALFGAALRLCVAPLAAAPSGTDTFTVTNTFDARAFSYRILGGESASGYQLVRLSFPSPVVTAHAENNTVPATLYLPEAAAAGDARRPAVVCLPILDGDETLTATMCSVLVQRGIPALRFTLPYYKERSSAAGREAFRANPGLLVDGIEQAIADIRRAADLLASRPEIDPQRLGITGISLGGIMSATAAGRDARFQRVGLILAGGDLLGIIHHAPETRALSSMLEQLQPAERTRIETRLRALDPLTSAPALRERARNDRVLMINASADEVIPPENTRKLAAALEMTNRVVWFEGLGHYTAIAEFPSALRQLADFFARDLPSNGPALASKKPAATPAQQLATVVQQAVTIFSVEPRPGRAHFLEADLTLTNSAGQETKGSARLVVGPAGKFNLRCTLPRVGEVSAGQGAFPWLRGGPNKTVFVGTKDQSTNMTFQSHLAPEHLMRYRVLVGGASALALVPDIAQKWVSVERDPTVADGQGVRITPRENGAMPGAARLRLTSDGATPAEAEFALGDAKGSLRFHRWQTNAVASDDVFEAPADGTRQEVAYADLCRMFSAVLNFAGELAGSGRQKAEGGAGLEVTARDPAGHGLLCRQGDKTILIVQGTPAQMGAAHGTLLGDATRRMVERVLYGMGAADTIASGEWFPDRLDRIQQRVQPHLPTRFFDECDALADATGIARRDVRFANLFPERFHCSGVALRGKATLGGQVLHARVLDYMRDIGLQQSAAVVVFLPDRGHQWMTLGYAGFIGTVTAMNEKGLAIGEMGGAGDGQWDGVPMSFLLRDVMERAATVDEALGIIQKSLRTCEYYYVISDKSGALRALHCVPEKVVVLQPGQQHPGLPKVPDDVVFISAGDRAKVLSNRLHEHYGNIDAPRLMDIIKRPVAMKSNLHNAIFAPQSLEMWFADAGPKTPACDEPYARVRLDELVKFYHTHEAADGPGSPAAK